MKILISFLDSLNDVIHSLQRHDIIKKRLDDVGNTIDSRKGSVGGPKVYLSQASYALFHGFSVYG